MLVTNYYNAKSLRSNATISNFIDNRVSYFEKMSELVFTRGLTSLGDIIKISEAGLLHRIDTYRIKL